MKQLTSTPTLQALQQYMKEMEAERGFDDESVIQQCLLLGEEVGELFKSIRKTHGGLKIDITSKDANPADEIADVLILLTCIANRLGIDLEQAVRDKEDKNNKRTWE